MFALIPKHIERQLHYILSSSSRLTEPYTYTRSFPYRERRKLLAHVLDLRSHIKLRDNRSSRKYRQIFGIEYIRETRSQQDTQLNSEIKTTNIKFR